MNFNGTLQCCRTGLLISGFIRPTHRKCVIFDLIGIINHYYWIKDTSLDWEAINFSNESEIAERKTRNKLFLLSKQLDAEILDYAKLKQMCWSGVPSSIRSTIWKLLLKYTPKKLSRRNKQLANKRNQYHALRQLYFDAAVSNPNQLDVYQQKLLRCTQLDIKRIRYNFPENQILKNVALQSLLQRVLYMFGLKHSCIGYSHGILDILIIITLSLLPPHHHQNHTSYHHHHHTHGTISNWEVIEADTYWCLENLFESKQLFNNYTHDLSTTLNMLHCVQWVVKKVNHSLYAHFQRERVDFNQFWQWIHSFLIRKMSIEHVMKVWDSLLSTSDDEFNSFHVCICASLLTSFSGLLETMDFAQIIVFTQSIAAHTSLWSKKDVDSLLAEAFTYHELYAQKIKLMIQTLNQND
eukprot:2085_1